MVLADPRLSRFYVSPPITYKCMHPSPHTPYISSSISTYSILCVQQKAYMFPALVMTAAETSIKKDGHVSDNEDSFYFKGVKHLCETGIAKVPSKYILPVSDRPRLINEEDTTIQELNLKLPIIDFAELHGPNRSRVLESLNSACENHGFFQLINHGISSDVINNMMDVGRRFFELPFEEREKFMSIDMRSPVRYGTSFNQTKDGVFCWRDFLKLVCHPLPEALPHWPSFPLDFRNKGVTYANESRTVFLELVKAILESLELTTEKETLEMEEILKEFEDGSHLMVLNCYPPCPQPELTFGMPPHSDYGFVTLVLQDEVEGLQIMSQDRWLTVQPVPNSFVVNVGDHLEIFSNGRYKSVLHRVLANSLKSRISIASLHSLPFESTVRPWPKLIDEENPRQYMDTNFSDFQNYLELCDAKKKNFLESRKLKIEDNVSLESRKLKRGKRTRE